MWEIENHPIFSSGGSLTNQPLSNGVVNEFYSGRGKDCELQMEVEAAASNAGRYFLKGEGEGDGNESGCYIDDYDDEDDSEGSETNFIVVK